MRKISALVVMVAMVAAMAVFVAPAAAEEAPLLPSDITSFKFYDSNGDGKWWVNGEDGMWAWDEPKIPGWRVELWQGGILVDVAYTNASGWYLFEDVAPGDYIIKEGVAGGCWVQTYPNLRFGRSYHPVTVTGDGRTLRCETPFGNFCKDYVCGFTPGYWGNKNGLAAMKAFVAGGGVLPEGMSAKQWNDYFRAGSTAVKMCDKLMWHYWAHQMNVLVKGIDYSGAKVYVWGELVDYDDAMADFAGCTGDRGADEFYKDIFDKLNNGRGWVIASYEDAMKLCPLPW